MRESDGGGKKGPQPLNAHADPVFKPPTRRFDPGYGAIGSGRPQPVGPAPLQLGMPHSGGPALSSMTPPVLTSASRTVMPPIENRSQNPVSATQLAPMGARPLNPSSGTGLTPMRHRPSSGADASGLSPMLHRSSGSAGSGPQADHMAIDMALVQQPMHPPMQPLAQAPASTETVRQKVGKFAPLVDGAAAAVSLAASRVVPGSMASTATGAVSGLLWSGGAAMSEAGNTQPASRLASTANFLSFGAGALSTATAFNSDSTQTNLGYASSAAWGLSALTSMAHAAYDGTRSRVSRGLQVASGVANLAAAGLSAASVRASSENDTTGAAWYGTASSLSWMAGAAFAYGSARTASNPSTRVLPSVASASTPLQASGPGRSFGTTIQSV